MARTPETPNRGLPTLRGKVHDDVVTAIRLLDQALGRIEHSQPAAGTGSTPVVLDAAMLARIRAALEMGGTTPLNVTDLLGVLAQPQIAGAPKVLALPDPQMSQDGQLCNYNGQLYWFDAATDVGTWRAITAVAVLLSDTHAVRLVTYLPAAYPVGTLYWETDRAALYVVAVSGGVNVWQYRLGMMRGTVAPDLRPADLGVNDTEFLFFATDQGIEYRWTGAAWNYHRGALSGTAAAMPAAASCDIGFLYIQADRNYLVYRKYAAGMVYVQGVGGPMRGTLAPDQKPAGLGANDAGLMFYATDFDRTFRWNGAAWADGEGQPPRQMWAYFGVAPGVGWTMADGSPTTISTSTGGTAPFVTPDLITNNPVLRGAFAAGGTGGAATHKHSVDPPSTTSGGPSGTVRVDNNLDLSTVGAGNDIHTHDTNIAAFDSAAASSYPPYVEGLPYMRV